MILGLLGLVLPFVGRFLGDNVVEKVLAHKREQLTSATELEKAKLNADIKYGEQELERRKIIRDLQLKEYEHPLMWWPKWLLLMSVCLYWAIRFSVKFIGLDDFGVSISDLNTEEAYVSGLVLAYLLISGDIRKALR